MFVCVCVCVCVFIELHITAQSDPIILGILCHSKCMSASVRVCVCACVCPGLVKPLKGGPMIQCMCVCACVRVPRACVAMNSTALAPGSAGDECQLSIATNWSLTVSGSMELENVSLGPRCPSGATKKKAGNNRTQFGGEKMRFEHVELLDE